YDPATGQFIATGNMQDTRNSGTATLLYTGKVLLVGGNFNSSAELYDPATSKFSSTSHTQSNFLADHTATLLADGKVLVAGGTVNNPFRGETHAEIYDPASGTFSVTGSMAVGRTRLRASLLPNGKVLITGGVTEFDAQGNRNWTAFASTEIYDPS